MNLFSNPEVLRNARIQWRPRKLLIAAGICAAISVVLGYVSFHGRGDIYVNGVFYGGGQELLHVMLWIQAFVLVIGGGIACLHAIQREKDQNTFDFQRITRLSPLELTIGKLFGSMLMAFFVFFCFLPAAIVGAAVAGTSATILFVTYVLMILGSIVYCAFALVISLFLRRGAVTWATLFYLAFVAITSFEWWGALHLAFGAVSPFAAVNLARAGSWSLAPKTIQAGVAVFTTPNPFHDVFFGLTAHHALVLFIFYLTILAWLLLAITRNIKRDPTNYKIYAPAQAFGFLCYLNFILFAFFRWNAPALNHLGGRFPSFTPFEAQSALLGTNIFLFFIFGFILLRNRNQMRRSLHGENPASAGWLEFWPAPYLFLGALVVGAAMILMVQWKRDPALEWSLAVAVFRVAFFAFWIICNFLFLQWMNLRRAGHSLLVGVLYLIVYYICALIVIGSLNLSHSPFAAIFLPTPLFVLNSARWMAHEPVWLLALALQIIAGIVFVLLQRRRLEELRPHAPRVFTDTAAPAASAPPS